MILLRHLRSLLIGSNRQKHRIIEQGIVPRLINLLSESSTSTELRISVAYTICSIAKGIDQVKPTSCDIKMRTKFMFIIDNVKL